MRLLLDAVIQLGEEWDDDDLTAATVAYVCANACIDLFGFERQ